MSRENEYIFSRRTFLQSIPVSLAATLLSFVPENSKSQFRSRNEAIRTAGLRRNWHGFLSRKEGREESELEQLLKTDFEEAPFGIINGHLWEENEELDFPPRVTFPIKPWNFIFEYNGQFIPSFANSLNGLGFREGGSKAALTRVFDRTIYMANHIDRFMDDKLGVILELDETTDEQLRFIVPLLASYGIKRFIVGNEPNSLVAANLSNPPTPEKIFHACKIVEDAINQISYEYPTIALDCQVSSPGFAYYGNGEYQLHYLKELARMGHGQYPMDRFSEHFYGPVSDLIPRAGMIQHLLLNNNGGLLKIDLTEIGRPEGVEPMSDEQYAEEDLAPKLILATNCGIFDSVDIYSLLDGRPYDSLALVQGKKLYPKPSYQVAKNLGKLLARRSNWNVSEDNPRYFKVNFRRTDGIHGAIYTSRNHQELLLEKFESDFVFDVFGRRIKEKSTRFSLPGQTRDDLGGSPRIVIFN